MCLTQTRPAPTRFYSNLIIFYIFVKPFCVFFFIFLWHLQRKISAIFELALLSPPLPSPPLWCFALVIVFFEERAEKLWYWAQVLPTISGYGYAVFIFFFYYLTVHHVDPKSLRAFNVKSFFIIFFFIRTGKPAVENRVCRVDSGTVLKTGRSVTKHGAHCPYRYFFVRSVVNRAGDTTRPARSGLRLHV